METCGFIMLAISSEPRGIKERLPRSLNTSDIRILSSFPVKESPPVVIHLHSNALFVKSGLDLSSLMHI
jgi:hypothetical protein